MPFSFTNLPAQRRRGRRGLFVTDLGRELVELSLPVVREIESAWQAHLGAARTRELRRTLEALREITDPFAELTVLD